MAWVKGRVRTRGRTPTSHTGGSYLDTLFTATEKPRVRQLERLLGLGALLPVVLQPAELPFVYGESLKRLLRAKVALKALKHRELQCLVGLGTHAPHGEEVEGARWESAKLCGLEQVYICECSTRHTLLLYGRY